MSHSCPFVRLISCLFYFHRKNESALMVLPCINLPQIFLNSDMNAKRISYRVQSLSIKRRICEMQILGSRIQRVLLCFRVKICYLTSRKFSNRESRLLLVSGRINHHGGRDKRSNRGSIDSKMYITSDNVCFLVVRCWSCTIVQNGSLCHLSNDSLQRLLDDRPI